MRDDAAFIEIDFPGLPNLERLRLRTYTGSFNTITQILRNLSSLKHLTLFICLQFKGRDITQVDWSLLTDFLSGRRSSFQHTDLYIRAVKASGEVASDEVISMLSRYEILMSLVEAGYVSIREENTLTFMLIGASSRSIDSPKFYGVLRRSSFVSGLEATMSPKSIDPISFLIDFLPSNTPTFTSVP